MGERKLAKDRGNYQCAKCGTWVWSWNKTPHRCPPRWRVWVKDAKHTEMEVYAANQQAAAEIFADKFDFDGSMAHEGCDLEVVVITWDRGAYQVPEYYAVRCETVPHYLATEHD